MPSTSDQSDETHQRGRHMATESLDPVEEGLRRRERRQLEAARNWCELLLRKAQLGLPELPLNDDNRVKTRGDPPAAFALTLQSVDGWPLKRTLLKRVETSGNRIEFSVSLSLFHLPTRSFFGSTFQSKAGISGSAKNGPAGIKLFEVTLNEVALWYTYIDDPRTLVIAELVATEVDCTHGINVATYGCGWTFLEPTPFGRRGIVDLDDRVADEASLIPRTKSGRRHRTRKHEVEMERSSYLSSPILKGTPRSLALLSSGVSPSEHLRALVASARTSGVCGLRYRVVQHHALLKARHLIAENDLVAATDPVPGLRPTRMLVPSSLSSGKETDRESRPKKIAAFGCRLVSRKSRDATQSRRRKWRLSSGSSTESDRDKEEDAPRRRSGGLLREAVVVERRVRLDQSALTLVLSRCVCRVQDMREMESLLRLSFTWSLPTPESRAAAFARLKSRGDISALSSARSSSLASDAEVAQMFPLSEPQKIGFKILSRRLRFAIHNGRKFVDLLGNQGDSPSCVLDLRERENPSPESEGNQAPLTELLPGATSRDGGKRSSSSSSAKEVILHRFSRSPQCALVALLEYEVRPEQNGLRVPVEPSVANTPLGELLRSPQRRGAASEEHTAQASSAQSSSEEHPEGGAPSGREGGDGGGGDLDAYLSRHSESVSVVVGSAVFLPFNDGKRLRLRSTSDVRLQRPCDEKANRFQLPLHVDAVTRTLAAQLPHRPHVWPPPGEDELFDGHRGNGGDEDAMNKPMRLVRFKCDAYQMPPPPHTRTTKSNERRRKQSSHLAETKEVDDDEDTLSLASPLSSPIPVPDETPDDPADEEDSEVEGDVGSDDSSDDDDDDSGDDSSDSEEVEMAALREEVEMDTKKKKEKPRRVVKEEEEEEPALPLSLSPSSDGSSAEKSSLESAHRSPIAQDTARRLVVSFEKQSPRRAPKEQEDDDGEGGYGEWRTNGREADGRSWFDEGGAGSLLSHTLQAPILMEGEGAPAGLTHTHANTEFGGTSAGDGRSLMAATVNAPVTTSTGPGQKADTTTQHWDPGLVSGFDMSRSSHARLAQEQQRHLLSRPTVPASLSEAFAGRKQHAAAVAAELCDRNTKSVLNFRFAAYRAPERTSPLPQSLTFSYRFFDRPAVRSRRALLKLPKHPSSSAAAGGGGGGGSRSGSCSNAIPRVLVAEEREDGVSRWSQPSRGEAALEERVVVDVSEMTSGEAHDLFTYLASRHMLLDLWDGDSLIHLGSAWVPLRALLRQGRPSVHHAIELNVVAPFDSGGGEQDVTTILAGGVMAGKLVGHLQLVLENFGQRGAGDRAGAKHRHQPSSMSSEWESGDPASVVRQSMNWRLGVKQPPVFTDEQQHQHSKQQRKQRPSHRKRARPIAQASAEVNQAVEAYNNQGGTLASTSRHAASSSSTSSSEPNAITYEELLLVAKRFGAVGGGAASKGRVRYTGPLLQLLDVPCLAWAEQRLVRDLTRLEERRSLEHVASLLDRGGKGAIRAEDLVEGLASLCPGSFGKLKPREAHLVVNRIVVATERKSGRAAAEGPSEGGGSSPSVPTSGFVSWIRERQDNGDAEAKLRKLLKKAEAKLGISVGDVFAKYESARGAVSAANFLQAVRSLQRSLGSRDAEASARAFLTDAQLRRFVASRGGSAAGDSTQSGGGGGLHLSAFLKAMGCEYTIGTRGAEKLAQVLAKRKLVLEADFEKWRQDEGAAAAGSGVDAPESRKELGATVSVKGVVAGLTANGLLRDGRLSESAAHAAVASELDSGGTGRVGLRALLVKAGRDPDQELKAIVGRALAGEGLATVPSLEEQVGRWDRSGVGKLSADDVREGVAAHERESSVSCPHRSGGLGPNSLVRLLSDSDMLAVFARAPNAAEGATQQEVSRDTVLTWGMKHAKPSMASQLAAVVTHAEKAKSLSISKLFREWDSDGDGTLDVSELQKGLDSIGIFGTLDRGAVSELLRQTGAANKQDPQQEGGATSAAAAGVRVSFRGFMQLIGRRYSSYVEARLAEVVETAGISLQGAFEAFDTDGDGMVTRAELLQGLQSLQGFEETSDEDARELMQVFDADGDGTMSLGEFCSVFGQKYSASDAEAKFVAVLRKAKLVGDELGKSFDEELDLDGDGELSAGELLTGLHALGAFVPVLRDVTMRDAEAVVNSMNLASSSTAGPGGVVCTKESFLKWGVKQGLLSASEAEAIVAAAPPRREHSNTDEEEGKHQEEEAVASEPAGGHGDEDESEEKSSWPDDDNLAGKASAASAESYVFSRDPATAAVERRLRRVAQRFQARVERSGADCDVEQLFRQYDPEDSGTLLRSELVNVLMQLGLALLDVPSTANSSSSSSDGGSLFGGDERRRRMAQLSRVKGPLDKRTVRLRSSQSPGHDAGDRADESLALIKWYREGHKKKMVRSMVEAEVKCEYHLFPRFGETLFFEHPITNPLSSEERLIVDTGDLGDDGCMRVVDDAEEWAHLRKYAPPPHGMFPPLGPVVESDMLLRDDSNGIGMAQVWVRPRETIHLPLAFLSTQHKRRPGNSGSSGGNDYGDDNEGEHTRVLKLVSATHGVVLNLVLLHVHPRAPIVHRTLRFAQREGSILKRLVRVHVGSSGHDMIRAEGGGGWSSQNSGDAKFVSVVEFSAGNAGIGRNVVLESRHSPGEMQEVLIKYSKLGAFPNSGDFYIFLYEDRFRARVHELWHVVVSSRLAKDVHSVLGQASTSDLVVRGDRSGAASRRCRIFCANEVEVEVSPAGDFELLPGVYNQLGLKFTPVGHPGTRQSTLHLVDVDSRQLVCAWLFTGTASAPAVTKEFDVDVVVGEAAHKKVAYTNPWSHPQRYHLRSSDPNRVRPKDNNVAIEPQGHAYLRLYVAPVERPGRYETFLLVNDDADQNDECFRISVNAHW